MHTASIGIMHNKVDLGSKPLESKPQVPKELFECAKRVIDSKGCEVVRTQSGLYVVQYSLTGPWYEAGIDGWLPVLVIQVLNWTSGGITEEEMASFSHSQEISD